MNMIELIDVSKRYRGETARPLAVDNVSFSCPQGAIFGLLGPNGAGKSTCIDMIAGLRSQTAGTVSTLGVDPVADRDTIRRNVGVQPQHADLFEAETVRELFDVWASFYPKPHRPTDLIDRLNLGESAHMPIRKLSGGQRQRVLVGLALISRPQLVILDEPTAGLDPNAREALWEVLREAQLTGTTILLSTHLMEEAEQVCDRLVILAEGKVVADGAPADLISKFAPETTMTLTVPADADIAALAALPGVRAVTHGEQLGETKIVTLQGDRHALTLKDVVATVPVLDVAITTASLGAVFSRVTHPIPEAELEEENSRPLDIERSPTSL